jgi:hypothetical protein
MYSAMPVRRMTIHHLSALWADVVDTRKVHFSLLPIVQVIYGPGMDLTMEAKENVTARKALLELIR